MDNSAKINYKINLLIMALPVSILAIPIIIGFGESAFLLVIPLIIELYLRMCMRYIL